MLDVNKFLDYNQYINIICLINFYIANAFNNLFYL